MENAVKKGIKKEIKMHPKRSVLTFILLVTLAIAFIEAIRQYNWISMLLIIAISVLICLPVIVGKLSKINIPLPLGIFAILFIYATTFLGEFKNYYVKFWWWDLLLHTSSGIALGIIGFLILYMLYKAEKIKTSPKIVAMFSFAFALSIGVLWEVLEFAVDQIWGPISNNAAMQTLVNGCGLVDTMKDIIADSVGALFSAIMGYLYLKKESGIVVKPMAKEFKKNNPRLFKRNRK